MRRGIGADGEPWEVRMPAHYGYFKKSEGADGDHVDFTSGRNLRSPSVFVIDQKDAETGKFDEHKCMLGICLERAGAGGLSQGVLRWPGNDRIGNVKMMTVDEFKDWLKNGDTKKAIKRAAGGRIEYAEGGALPDAPWASTPTPSALPDAPWAPEVKPEPKVESWSDVPMAALKNAPASAVKFGSDLIQPILHPVDTATGLKNLALGVAEKTGMKSGAENIPYADAVGQFFSDRYGGMENFKQTMASDPVGFAADLSMLLTGGGSAAARVPVIGGKVAEVANTASRMVDPLTAVGKTAQVAGKGASEIIGGVGTHTGAEPLRAAARAGYEGGEGARAFQENMRGAAAAEETVEEARGALAQMRKERGETYREGMKDIAADPAVLSFDKVDDALTNISGVKVFKGQNIAPKTQAIREEIGTAIKEWKALDPAEFHTVEGFDALKQKLGDIRDATAYGTPERVVANRAYDAVRKTIVEQAPEYGRVMKGYEEASKQIKEIERTLSLNPGASIDTALRKLQSVLRNNVNTNYGRRAELAEVLVNAGAPNLMQKLAGQALSSWTPRGLGKLSASLGAEILAMSAGHMAAGPAGALTAGATLPFMSPRLMGELSYYTGKAARHLPLRGAGDTAFQTGRAEDELTRRAIPSP
jgi:hypothetical protein